MIILYVEMKYKPHLNRVTIEHCLLTQLHKERYVVLIVQS